MSQFRTTPFFKPASRCAPATARAAKRAIHRRTQKPSAYANECGTACRARRHSTPDRVGRRAPCARAARYLRGSGGPAPKPPPAGAWGPASAWRPRSPIFACDKRAAMPPAFSGGSSPIPPKGSQSASHVCRRPRRRARFALGVLAPYHLRRGFPRRHPIIVHCSGAHVIPRTARHQFGIQ